MSNSTPSTQCPYFLKRLLHFSILFFFLAISNVSNGQLLQWNTAGNLGTETAEPSVANDANIAAASLAQGSITAAANGNRFGGSGWFNAGNTVGGNTLAEAVAGNDYIQFIVTPNAGFSFTPTSLVFFWDRSASGPSSATLRSSADGFTSDLGTVTGMVSGGAALTTTRTINISTLTNITTATTFRLYGYAATATGGTGGFDHTTGSVVPNVVLNGSTAPLVVNYSVTYNGNGNTGGTAPVDGSSPYAPGSNVTVLSEGSLVRTGYTFSGWNTAADGSGSAYASGGTITNISANTTLFAQWTINTYTVTYDGNGNDGGTAPTDGSSPYNYGSNVTVLGPGTLSLTGFNFNGWNTAADGSGTAYAAGGTITGIASNITLYAQWLNASTFSVTYFGNGNDGGTAPVDGSSPYASGSNVTVLSQGTLTRTGYTFSGWNTLSDGTGTAYASGGTITSIAANTTLFAQWTINTYTVTYDGNGSDGGSVPVDGSSPYNYNSNVTVLGPGTMTRTNYNFTGWNTAANGTGTAYTAGNIITGIAANTTLFAQWALITYTVTYNGNTNTGGTAPVDGSSPYAIGSNVTVQLQGTLLKTGHTFTGWNTQADGLGTSYAAGGTINNLSANTVLFAQWLINQYTVTYDGNGNTGGSAPVDASSPYNFGTVVTVLTNSGGLVKTGSTFAGWNTSPAGTGTNYAATGSATFTLGAANVVLYAKWAEPLYESFNYTVGENIGGNTAAAGTTNNNWTTHSNSQVGTINVTTGSLSYAGLQSSTGNMVRLPGTNATVPRDVNRAVAVAGSVAYYSFLLNVADNLQLGTGGDYFTGLGGTSGGSVTALYGRVNIKSTNAGTSYRLAISNSTGGTPTFTDFATDLSFATTYLVVVKYDFNGAANDIATLWVNPSSLGGAEPAGGVSNSSGTVGQTNFGSVFLRNSSGTPKADIDEIRVAGTWAEVTPAGNYTITASAGPNGTISPNGVTVLSPGDNQTYTITPSTSPCYDVLDVLVDGISVGPLKTYTFNNVSSNHTISATFAASIFTQWTGAVSTDWNDPANWTSCVPDATLYTYVPENGNAGVTQQPVLTSDATTFDLELGPGASVTIGSNTLNINGSYAYNTGALLIGSPTSNLTFSNSANLSSAAPIVLKNLTVNSNILTLESEVEITGGTAANTSGTVTIASGAQIASGGFLTLKSNQFGTARVAAGDVAGNYITGNVIVERYIPANSFRSWRLLSVPTFGASQTFKQSWQENNTPLGNNKPNYGTQITGTGALATAQANGFDNIAQQPALLSWTGTAWAGVPNTISTIIDTKRGYFLYTRGERTQGVTNSSSSPTATTLRTTGQLYQGDQLIPAFPASSFNLVGNLYASAIDFTLLTRTGGVSNLFYIWDSKKLNGTSLGQYQTFSSTNSFNCLVGGGSYVLGQPNTKIESGQAFFVQTAAAGTITLTEASKVANSANLGFRPVRPVTSLVKLDSRIYAANSTEITDANVVVFDDIYSNKVAEEDALKLANPSENFAIVQDNKSLAIEGRRTITDADNIQFNLWNLKQQQYKLELVPQNLGNEGLTAILEDAYLKTSAPVDLTATNTVTFTVDANPASQANRFKVVFNRLQPAISKQGFTIAPNPVENGIINVVFNKQAAGVYQVRIVNNLGQILTTRTINHAGGNSNHVIALPKGTGNGIYQAEIIAPDKTKSTNRVLVNTK